MQLYNTDLMESINNLLATAEEIFQEGTVYAGYIGRGGGNFHYNFHINYISAKDRQNTDIAISVKQSSQLIKYTKLILSCIQDKIGSMIDNMHIEGNKHRYRLSVEIPSVMIRITIPDLTELNEINHIVRNALKRELETEVESCSISPDKHGIYKCRVKPSNAITIFVESEENDKIVGVMHDNKSPYVYFPVNHPSRFCESDRKVCTIR